MHAGDAAAVLADAGDRGDPQRRGVRGEDRGGADKSLELAEESPFEFEILGDGLDDDGARRESGQRVDDAQPGLGGGRVIGAHCVFSTWRSSIRAMNRSASRAAPSVASNINLLIPDSHPAMRRR